MMDNLEKMCKHALHGIIYLQQAKSELYNPSKALDFLKRASTEFRIIHKHHPKLYYVVIEAYDDIMKEYVKLHSGKPYKAHELDDLDKEGLRVKF
jgi:hypothetical protein